VTTPLAVIEAQFSVAKQAAQRHLQHADNAFRAGDPVLAQVELGNVTARIAACNHLIDRLAEQIELDAPELRPCRDCGQRSGFGCKCTEHWCVDCGRTLTQCRCFDASAKESMP